MKLSGAMNLDGETSPRTKLDSLPAKGRRSCESYPIRSDRPFRRNCEVPVECPLKLSRWHVPRRTASDQGKRRKKLRGRDSNSQPSGRGSRNVVNWKNPIYLAYWVISLTAVYRD